METHGTVLTVETAFGQPDAIGRQGQASLRALDHDFGLKFPILQGGLSGGPLKIGFDRS